MSVRARSRSGPVTSTRTEAIFGGATLALLAGPRLVTILRDDVPHIPWPGHWDFPGGAREGDEGPEACALGKTREELGLTLSVSRLIWRRCYRTAAGQPVWFFAAHLAEAEITDIRMGDKGQGWH